MSLPRRRLWLALKTAVAAALVVAVGRHFAHLLGNEGVRDRLRGARPEYLLPAGLLYLGAHTIWGTFWVQLLRGQGAELSWFAGLRAYFVSQFGKYVPGKAWVLVLRVGLLRREGVPPAVAAVTGTYETLTSMGAGALIAVCLLPWLGDRLAASLGPGRWVALAGLGGLPLVAGVLHRLGARVAKKYRGPDARPLAVPALGLLARGLVQNAAGWCLLGLSLGLTVRGLAGDAGPLTPDGYLRDLAAAALSYVAGFVVLVSPGGLGAREFVLQQTLAPQLAATGGPDADALAAVVALVLRLVWTGFEVAFALLLLVAGRPRTPAPAAPEAARA